MTDRGQRIVKTTLLVAGGAALGAGLMYLFDPATGKTRRAWVGQKATGIAKKTGKAIAGTAATLKNRTFSLVHSSRENIDSDRSAGIS